MHLRFVGLERAQQEGVMFDGTRPVQSPGVTNLHLLGTRNRNLFRILPSLS